MSTTPQSPSPETYRCAECGGDRPAHDSVHGSFCSHQCYYRQKGRKALRQIKHDHRFCSTCFRPIKSVLPPAETHPDWVVGWQFPTEFMEHAIDEFRADNADNWRTDGNAPADRVERTRWSCQCGAVDTGHRYLELEDVDPILTITSAARCLSRLASEGTIGGAFDRERYKRAIADHYLTTRDAGVSGTDWHGWEYTAGYTLYGPPTADG